MLIDLPDPIDTDRVKFKKGDTAYLPSADGVTEHVVTQVGHARVRLRGVGWRDRVELWDDRDGAMVRHRWLADARQQGSAVHGEYRDLLSKAHAITLTLHGYINAPAATRAGLRERLRDMLESVDALDRQHGRGVQVSLADARVGDTIMVGDPWNAQPAVVGKVGRDWLYTEQNHAYSRATGKARGTNGRARTVIDWQRSMQAQVARAALRERGIDVGYQVDAVAIYEAVRPVFVLTLPPLPALESFEVPK